MNADQSSDSKWTRDVVSLTVGVALLAASAFVLLRGFDMPQPGPAPTARAGVQVDR